MTVPLICLAIIPVTRNVRRLGRKKMTECGKDMVQVKNGVYLCPNGHKRFYPPRAQGLF